MTTPRTFKPTKLGLYQVVPKIIAAYRIPGGDILGRGNGPPTHDECAGASDILYHLMCTDTITLMARHLHIDPQRLFDAIDLGLHSIDPATPPSAPVQT